MTYRHNEPYNDLPYLPPRQEIETRDVMRLAIDAARAVAELKGAGGRLPNQAILINAIPLQEAQASSEIENIVTTQDALYRAVVGEDGHQPDPQTREVLRYRQALRSGYDAISAGRVISIDLMMEICGMLLDADVDLRDHEPIIVEDQARSRLIYTPPRGRETIVQLLHNLEDYLLAEDGTDPLIRMVVAHYQFEAIHPFGDGNGRTGRILNLLYLLQTNQLEIPVLYLSRYIIQHKPEYYRRIQAVTETGDWTGWLAFMLTAVADTARWTTARIGEIVDLLDETVERCREEIPSVYSKELIEAIFYHPYCKIQFLVEAGIAKRQAASKYLQELERIGVLVSEQRGRTVIYKNPELLKILSL